MVVKIFTNPINYTLENLYEKEDEEILIGVEDGAFHALKHNLNLDLVIGDFDSLDEMKQKVLFHKVKNIIKYPMKKDYTDTYLALKEALKYNPDLVIIYGGIGERFDHTYANLLLLKLGRIVCLTNTQKIYVLDPGEYDIKNHFKTISFFALEDVETLTLKGFLYDLKGYDLAIDDPLCISNEGSGKLSFSAGLLLVVESTGA